MELEIRLTAPSEWPLLAKLACDLRPHLDASAFLERARLQDIYGYQLHAAFQGGIPVGVMGARACCTLSRGPFLQIDDLVVDESQRGAGIGRHMMDYAEAFARSRGLGALYLEARPTAIGFYEKLGLDRHPSPVMRRVFG
jgi:GNAT superfamily N-acetyltransferase